MDPDTGSSVAASLGKAAFPARFFILIFKYANTSFINDWSPQ